MGNMSYCRFENTLADLQDCQQALFNIYEDVSSWWDSDKIQNARKDFCLKYANTQNPHPNDIIKNLLK